MQISYETSSDSFGESFSFSNLFYPAMDSDDENCCPTPQFARDDPTIFEENAMLPFSHCEDGMYGMNLPEPQVDSYSLDPTVTAIWNMERSRPLNSSCSSSPALQSSDLALVIVPEYVRESPVFSSLLSRVLRDRSMCRLDCDQLTNIINIYHTDLMTSMEIVDVQSRLFNYILTTVANKWTELTNVIANIKSEVDRKVQNWQMSDKPTLPVVAQMLEKVNEYMDQRILEADAALRSLLIEREMIVVAYAKSMFMERIDSGSDSNSESSNHSTSGSTSSKQSRGITKSTKLFRKKGRNSRVLSQEATSVLYDWFESHNTHPYPTLSEKKDLAQRTGLDVKQVNNWFVNKRCREWSKTSSKESSNS